MRMGSVRDEDEICAMRMGARIVVGGDKSQGCMVAKFRQKSSVFSLGNNRLMNNLSSASDPRACWRVAGLQIYASPVVTGRHAQHLNRLSVEVPRCEGDGTNLSILPLGN